MGMLIENRPVSCNYCDNTNVQGRESTSTDRFGRIIHECRWVCTKCGMVTRCDEHIEEKKDTK